MMIPISHVQAPPSSPLSITIYPSHPHTYLGVEPSSSSNAGHRIQCHTASSVITPPPPPRPYMAMPRRWDFIHPMRHVHNNSTSVIRQRLAFFSVNDRHSKRPENKNPSLPSFSDPFQKEACPPPSTPGLAFWWDVWLSIALPTHPGPSPSVRPPGRSQGCICQSATEYLRD